MTQDQKDLFRRTVRRLERGGIYDPTGQIVHLAEEINQYRAKIRHLEEALRQEPETIRHSMQIVNGEPEDVEHFKRQVAAKIALYLLDAGFIKFQSDFQFDTKGTPQLLLRGQVEVIKPQEEANE